MRIPRFTSASRQTAGDPLDGICPTPIAKIAGMKTGLEEFEEKPEREEIVATFGEARLVKANGRLELRGGSMSDRTEALEWLSKFIPGELARVRK